MTEREQLPDTTAAWTIYQSSSGGGDEFYCLNNTVATGNRPPGMTSTDGITSERYGSTVYCRAPGIAPPPGKVPFEFTVERNGANNEATLVAACELNPVIDGSRPSDYAHEVWFQSDSNVIRCFGYGAAPPPPGLYAVGDPGHIQAHADLVASVNDELARFGLGDPLPIKEEGDEAHLDDHNAIRAKLELLETTAGQTFTHGLPPVRSLGDPSHTDDHNQLAWAVSEVKGWAAWNVATGGTITTIENGNYPLAGRWRVHTFTGNGTFTVTRGLQPFRLLIIGGGGSGGTGEPNGSGGAGGGGGGYLSDAITLTKKPHTVVIGAGAHSNSDYYPSGPSGGDTSFDSIKCGGGGGGGTGAHVGDKPHGGGAGGRAGSGGGGGGGSGGSGATDRGRAGAGSGSNVATNISGSAKTYGVGGTGNDGWTQGTMSGEPGAGGASHMPVNGCVSYAGRAGVVIVAYRIG